MDSREAFEKHADQYDNFGDEWQDMGLDKHFIAGYEAGQASFQALDSCEPVMWSLQFDNGPVNHFTTYPTLEKAEDYATLCNIGKDKRDIKIIPLYTHPASDELDRLRALVASLECRLREAEDPINPNAFILRKQADAVEAEAYSIQGNVRGIRDGAVYLHLFNFASRLRKEANKQEQKS
jgi:hypothetical protein